ncbi:MAG: hypothetical protein QNK37_13105 [Acidobacteriota bacterium]|nr:hypothetical protein [Acidobacteriota bacterium]
MNGERFLFGPPVYSSALPSAESALHRQSKQNEDDRVRRNKYSLRQSLYEGSIDSIKVAQLMPLFQQGGINYRPKLPDACFKDVRADLAGNGITISALHIQAVLDLWGWHVQMAGAHDSNGCRLYGSASPMYIDAGRTTFLSLLGEKNHSGPAVALTMDRNTAVCHMSGRLRLLGEDYGKLSVRLDSNGFQVSLPNKGRIYAGAGLTFQRGRFFLNFRYCLPDVLDGHPIIPGLVLEGAVECSPCHFRQSLSFSLIGNDELHTSPKMRWHDPLKDEADLLAAYQLVEPFFRDFARYLRRETHRGVNGRK